jgi:hypothetical protein
LLNTVKDGLQTIYFHVERQASADVRRQLGIFSSYRLLVVEEDSTLPLDTAAKT